MPKFRHPLKTIIKHTIPTIILAAVISALPLSSASAATLTETTTQVTATATTSVQHVLTAAEKKAAAKKKKAALAKKDRQQIIKLAKKYRGIRYTFGGASPHSGFDCSGFTKYVYKKALKMNLPHSANAQSKLGKRVSFAHAKPGDLVIYSYPGDRNFHVAIYLSKTKIIHAKEAGTVTQIGPLNWHSGETRIYVDLVDPHVDA